MTVPEQKNIRKLPAIKRAREYHLFDQAGRRYLDLFLNEGRAFLGHRPYGLSLQIKNILARGVYAPYPGTEESKLFTAAKSLWASDFPFMAYFQSIDKALIAVQQKGYELSDPALGEEGRFSYWRPGLGASSVAEVILPIIPCPGMEMGVMICSKIELFEEGDIPSPISAAALSRSVWNLQHFIDPPVKASGRVVAPGVQSPIEDFNVGTHWVKRGPYLQSTLSEDEYATLFDKALELRVLLPPSKKSPLILPLEIGKGEYKVLKSLIED